MKNYSLAVIGGGASGLCAAINCARHNRKYKIVIFERLPRVGKKILATGNGRCNLTNVDAEGHSYHNAGFAQFALNKYNVNQTLAFFKSVGLFTAADNEGRVYPMSNTASGVLDALRFEAARLDIEIICNTAVKQIDIINGKFIINNEICAEKIVIACGGKASPAQGSDGSGLELLRGIGYSITAISPALVQIKTKTDYIKSLKGIKAKAEISINIGGRCKASAGGELLFTDFGLSGIAAMEVGRCVSQHFLSGSKKSCEAVIDFAPTLQKEEIINAVGEAVKRNPNLQVENILTGIVPRTVSMAICRMAGVEDGSERISELSNDDINNLADYTKGFHLEVTGTKGFESAQVTAGGAEVEQFCPETLESKKHKGLYCCGEILDVDGGCGGFNLQWAWSSGLTAGENAACEA